MLDSQEGLRRPVSQSLKFLTVRQSCGTRWFPEKGNRRGGVRKTPDYLESVFEGSLPVRQESAPLPLGSPSRGTIWFHNFGGLLLRERFPGVDVEVQQEIDGRGGLLPVGRAIVVETGDFEVPYLVCAPTMVVPMDIVSDEPGLSGDEGFASGGSGLQFGEWRGHSIGGDS